MLNPRFKVSKIGRRYEKRTERYSSKFWVIVHQIGSDPLQMKLENVSKTGCKLQCLARLDSNEILWIKADQLPKIQARIVWSNAGSYGCKFEVPLSDEMLESLSS